MGALNTKTGGAFSSYPAASPKYAINDGALTTDYKGTMARIYLWMTDKAAADLKKYYRASEDPRIADLVEKVIATPTAPNKGYIEFLLQQANHELRDRLSVVDTLADVHATYAFGADPATFTYAVVWLNNQQDDQAANMYRLYWNVLRGIKLAGIQAELHLQYDNMRVSGIMTSISWALTANDESHCSGMFTLLVHKIKLLEAPQRVNGKSVYDGISVTKNVVSGGDVPFTNKPTTETLGDPPTRVELVRALVVTPPPVAAPGASAGTRP